jgi:hypothetical protein
MSEVVQQNSTSAFTDPLSRNHAVQLPPSHCGYTWYHYTLSSMDYTWSMLSNRFHKHHSIPGNPLFTTRFNYVLFSGCFPISLYCCWGNNPDLCTVNLWAHGWGGIICGGPLYGPWRIKPLGRNQWLWQPWALLPRVCEGVVMVLWRTGVKGGVSCPATVVVFWDVPAMALRVSLPHTQDAMCLDCGFQPTLNAHRQPAWAVTQRPMLHPKWHPI